MAFLIAIGHSWGAFLSRDSSPINLQLSQAAVLAAGVPLASIPINRRTGLPLETFSGHAPFLTNGDAPATDYVYTQRGSSVFDPNRFSQAVPDSERYGGFVNATDKICADQLVAYGDFFYQTVKTRYELAPSATGPFQVPGQTTLAIPPHEPGPVLGGPSYQDTGVSPALLILSIPFNRSYPEERAHGWRNLATGSITTRLTLCSQPWV